MSHFFIVMLSVTMLSVIILGVVAPMYAFSRTGERTLDLLVCFHFLSLSLPLSYNGTPRPSTIKLYTTVIVAMM